MKPNDSKFTRAAVAIGVLAVLTAAATTPGPPRAQDTTWNGMGRRLQNAVQPSIPPPVESAYVAQGGRAVHPRPASESRPSRPSPAMSIFS